MKKKTTSAVGKKRTSPLLSKYRALQRAKKSLCEGKATKTKVKSASTAYVKAAVAAGQTKTEATRKADRVLKQGCSMTSSIAGKRKRKTTSTVGKKRATVGTRARKR